MASNDQKSPEFSLGKKDRVAVSISALWIVIALVVLVNQASPGYGYRPDPFSESLTKFLIFVVIPVGGYWLWRWIRSAKQ